MTENKDLKKLIDKLENEITDINDPKTNDQLQTISKIDKIIKNRIKELTYVQIWVVRSEIRKVLRYNITCNIADNLYNTFYTMNCHMIEPVQSGINNSIQSEYPFTEDSLVFSIKNNLDKFKPNYGEFRIYDEIQDYLSKYLTDKFVDEICDKICDNYTDWYENLLNMIKIDIENMCGFTDDNEEIDTSKILDD